MPGPTTKGTYVGRSKGATLAAVHERRAETLTSDHPPCDVCGKPMTCGQKRSNNGAHFACRPSRAAFDKLPRGKDQEPCFVCWATMARTGVNTCEEHT